MIYVKILNNSSCQEVEFSFKDYKQTIEWLILYIIYHKYNRGQT